MDQHTNEPTISFVERHSDAMAVVIGVGFALFMFLDVILMVLLSG